MFKLSGRDLKFIKKELQLRSKKRKWTMRQLLVRLFFEIMLVLCCLQELWYRLSNNGGGGRDVEFSEKRWLGRDATGSRTAQHKIDYTIQVCSNCVVRTSIDPT